MASSHPRLADHAVVLRRGSSIQIGSCPDRAVVIDHPPQGLAELLLLVDGHHSPAVLAAHARRIPGLNWPGVMAALQRHRLLEEPAPADPLRAQVVTSGGWGLTVADLLLGAGAGQVTVALLGDDSGLLREAQLLAQRHRGRLFVHHQWSAPRTTDTLTIIDTPTVETDRAITAACAHHDITHLLVRPTADGVVVGPLVVPGASPCLNCLDLHARHLDPQWPQLMLQLTRVRLRAPQLARQWAAATAVTEIVAFYRTGHSALLGRTATVREPQWTPQWRVWRTHPGCLCHWDGRDVGRLMTAA